MLSKRKHKLAVLKTLCHRQTKIEKVCQTNMSCPPSIAEFLCNFFFLEVEEFGKSVQTWPPLRPKSFFAITIMWVMCSISCSCLFCFTYSACGTVLVCACLTDRPLVRTDLMACSGLLHPPAQCWKSSTGCSLSLQSAESECRSGLNQETQGQVSLKREPSFWGEKECQGYFQALKQTFKHE